MLRMQQLHRGILLLVLLLLLLLLPRSPQLEWFHIGCLPPLRLSRITPYPKPQLQ